jgi:hypothetical protein
MRKILIFYQCRPRALNKGTEGFLKGLTGSVLLDRLRFG